MKWLADENIPKGAIAFLRQRGEDVAAIAVSSPGIHDEKVLDGQFTVISEDNMRQRALPGYE